MEIYIIPEQMTTKEAVSTIPFDNKVDLERIVKMAKNAYVDICVYITDNTLSYSSLAFYLVNKVNLYTRYTEIDLRNAIGVLIGEV